MDSWALAGARSRHLPLGRPFWILFALAFAVRLVFACEVAWRSSGLDALDPLDPWFYSQSGERILDGDLDLRGFQEELRQRIRGGERRLGFNTYLLSDLGSSTFKELYGEQPLLGGLLYSYLVAGSLGLTGSTYALRWFQILILNLATCLLAYHLAWRCTRDRRAALATFALLAFHPTSVAYAGFLLRTTLICFVLLLFVWLADGFRRRPTVRAALALGASLGLVHLTKGITAICAPLWLAVLLYAPCTRSVRLRLAALSVAGFLVVLTPLMVRNVGAGASLLHGGSQGHVGLVVYNFEGADGVTLIRPPNDYVDRILKQSGGSQLSVLRHTIATHPSPASYVALELKKLRAFWNGYEGANNIDVSSARLWLRSLNALPFSTTLIVALALLGLAVSLSRARALAAVLAGLAICLVLCLASISLARYRLPALPYLAVLAGVAVSALWRAPAQGRWTLLAGGLLGTLLVAWPLHETPAPPQQLARWARSYQVHAPTTAQRITERAIRLHPLSALAPSAFRARAASGEDERLYLELYSRYLELCERTDDRGAQRSALERLAACYPESEAIRERFERLARPD